MCAYLVGALCGDVVLDLGGAGGVVRGEEHVEHRGQRRVGQGAGVNRKEKGGVSCLSYTCILI